MNGEKQWLEMRCSKCGKKLGEFRLKEGSIRILCMYNAGRGVGACKTLNTVTVRRKNNDSISKNAI